MPPDSNYLNGLNLRTAKFHATPIVHLNYDCLSKILRYLDLASQFAILQTHAIFKDIILFDLWCPFYVNTFDFQQDSSVLKRSMQFQCDLLEFVLHNFSRATHIPAVVFTRVMQITKVEDFDIVTELQIENTTRTHEYLALREFHRFSNLRKLSLNNCRVSLKHIKSLKSLHSFALLSSDVLSDEDTPSQWNHLFSCNLVKLEFRPSCSAFSQSTQFLLHCSQLKELITFTHFFNDCQRWDLLSHLPALTNLTLYSCGNLYFTPQDEKLFRAILSHCPARTVSCVEMYGIPDKWFFKDSNLKKVVSFTWVLDRIYHRRSDGCVEFYTNLKEIFHEFHKFSISSTNLKSLDVSANVLCSKWAQELNVGENCVNNRWQVRTDQLFEVTETSEVKKFKTSRHKENDSCDAFVKFTFDLQK